MRWGTPILATVLALTALLASIPAAAQTPAEQFVQDSADRAVAILTDKSLSEPDRKAQLRDFLSSVLDLRRIAAYTLGSVSLLNVDSTNPGALYAFNAGTLKEVKSVRSSDWAGKALGWSWRPGKPMPLYGQSIIKLI